MSRDQDASIAVTGIGSVQAMAAEIEDENTISLLNRTSSENADALTELAPTLKA